MGEALLNLAISIFLTKKNAKVLIRKINGKLQQTCKLKGKEVYIGYCEDAMKELGLRAECLSDDGSISDAECERINAFDESLVDKYWKEK